MRQTEVSNIQRHMPDKPARETGTLDSHTSSSIAVWVFLSLFELLEEGQSQRDGGISYRAVVTLNGQRFRIDTFGFGR